MRYFASRRVNNGAQNLQLGQIFVPSVGVNTRRREVSCLYIPASRFSDLPKGRIGVSMSLMKKLCKRLNIPAKFILDAA